MINGINFTSRELDIIACMVSGRRIKTIAGFLSIASKTVETHIRNIMLKLDCNSQETIITFIEKSGQLELLKQHYLSILTRDAFSKSLKEIAQLINKDPYQSISIYAEEGDQARNIMYKLEDYLKKIGLYAKTQTKRFLKISEGSTEHKDRVLYVVSEQTFENLKKTNQNDQNRDIKQTFAHHIFLLVCEANEHKNLNILNEMNCVDFRKSDKSYLAFFELLTKLFPDLNLDSILISFKQQSYAGQSLQAAIKTKENTLSINTPNLKIHEEMFVRSDLIIPVHATILGRDGLLSQINSAFDKQDEIQTLALVGIGGAGKTTLARLYAREQVRPVVWEINSETQESILFSFENLAYVLSQTEDEKKLLRSLSEMSNPKDKEDKIILFVREKLRAWSDWLLIYDNVERFTDIQKYFPFDVKTWGNGKIIITTRDSNIQHNSHVNKAISISELSIKEKLTLFNGIMSSEQPFHFSQDQTDAIESFVSYIPPFPLDVSIAAYYLKATNISYSNYIDYLNRYDKDLNTLQQSIIKEATLYAKTRYSIITLSIDCILKVNKEFEALLLFMSLIDSQNIAKEMLNCFKGEIIVDNFIYHLRKYSFTVCSPSDACRPSVDCHPIPAITIHRSTQEICLNYLIKIQNIDKKKEYIKQIVQALEKYIFNIIDNDDYTMMKNLKIHCEMFLKRSDIISPILQLPFYGILGSIYYHLGNYGKAQQLLTEHINKLKKQKTRGSVHLGWMLAYLGIVKMKFGNYKDSKKLLEQSNNIFNSLHGENHNRSIRILVYCGIVERKLGAFTKAKDIFEQSLQAYENDLNDKKGISWCVAQLGILEKELGNYKEGLTLLEHSTNIEKQIDSIHYSERTAWRLCHIADAYHEIGDYQKAKELIEESLVLYKKNIPDDHVKIAEARATLAKIYIACGNYQQAKTILKESLIVIEQSYGKHYINNVRVLVDLGYIYFQEDNLETAENLINTALRICQQNKPHKAYKPLEKLAEIYLKKETIAAQKNNLRQMKQYKNKAVSYLNQAQKIVENTYPKNSSHKIRIEARLRSLNKV